MFHVIFFFCKLLTLFFQRIYISCLYWFKTKKILYSKIKQVDVSLEVELKLVVQLFLRQSHIFSMARLHGPYRAGNRHYPTQFGVYNTRWNMDQEHSGRQRDRGKTWSPRWSEALTRVTLAIYLSCRLIKLVVTNNNFIWNISLTTVTTWYLDHGKYKL